jgi:ethanolamine utilization protein EutP
MKKLILVGRSGAGKTTLTQRLKGEALNYRKTQSIEYGFNLIDTPGEYSETKHLSHAISLYAYEADIVGLLLSATEELCLFPPNITCLLNREVIGIITKIDEKDADIEYAEARLELSGCSKIFKVSSVTGEGIKELTDYLSK